MERQTSAQHTPAHTPTMQPSKEANEEQLQLARAQGDAFGKAVARLTQKVAEEGVLQRAGDYLVGYAVEAAEGLYHMRDGTLEWVEPGDENIHVEVAVRDGADGRFVPGLTVYATLIDASGAEVGRHQQPFLWHPWVYHYGRNWTVPGSGMYTLRVHVEPPTFSRHDKINGRRYTEPVDVEFRNVHIDTGRKKS